ncbi:MAG: autotransporter domain-containing protein [Proteobacteria bacterium]|nr:autotransporter domain-containing protein [Pseudomonadota bacterium]
MKRPQALILSQALLVSASLTAFPTVSAAFQDLGVAQNGSNSAIFTPAAGYNYVAPNITFTILNNTTIGTTNVSGDQISVDNNVPDTVNGFNNTVMQFVGNVDINGYVGIYNPISSFLLNTGNIANNTFAFHQAGYNVTNTHIVGLGGTTILLDNVNFKNFNSNFTTNNNNTDKIQVNNGSAFIFGIIGTPTHRFAEILLDLGGDIIFFDKVFANQFIFLSPGSGFGFDVNISPTGPITTQAGDGSGRVLLGGNNTINFDIGAVGAALFQVSMFGSSGTYVDLNANIVSNSVELVSGTTLKVSGSRIIETLDLDVSNGTISLANNALLTVMGDINFNGPSSALAVDMGGNLSTTGLIDASGQANMPLNTRLIINNSGFSPGQSTVIPILQGMGGTINTPNIVTPGNFLTSFSTSIVGDTLNLVITSEPLSIFADRTNTQGVAQALDSIALGMPIPGLDSILGQLVLFSDSDALNDALATLAPMVDGAIMYESFNNQNRILGTIGDRMDRMNFWRQHLPPIKGGVNSGDKADADDGIWMQVYRWHANQKKRQSIPGYKDNTWGVILGTDRMITENSLIGVSLSWSTLDINNDVSLSKTKVDSYQATLYTDIDFNCPLYFKGAVGAAYNNYTSARNVVFNEVAFFPRGRFHGTQVGVKGEMGYVFGGFNYHAIPMVSMFYSHLDMRGYQETGAGAVGLLVDGANFNTFLLGLGGKLVDDYAMNQYMLFQSEIHAMAFYDLFNDPMQLTSQFNGSGPSFNTQGFTPVQDCFDIGVGVTLFTHYSFNLTGVYDFNFKDGYKAHSGFFRARYEFA